MGATTPNKIFVTYQKRIDAFYLSWNNEPLKQKVKIILRLS